MIDSDADGVINFKEFAITLGLICRGDLQQRLNFIYRLHLPPALPLSELEDGNSPDEDGGVESCSDVDEAEECDESDGIDMHNGASLLDPLGAGVVVIQGKVTRQSSTESERSGRNVKPHLPKSENISSEQSASDDRQADFDNFTKDSADTPNVSETVTNVSETVTNVSKNLPNCLKDVDNSFDCPTAILKENTKASEGSANASEASSEIWDGCSIESDNMEFDLITQNELVDEDGEGYLRDTKGQPGVYHVVVGPEATDATARGKIGQLSEVDGSCAENMNQVCRKISRYCD